MKIDVLWVQTVRELAHTRRCSVQSETRTRVALVMFILPSEARETTNTHRQLPT